MSEKVSTDSLLKRIIKTKNLTSFIQRNEQHMQALDFCALLKKLCAQYDVIPERVILRAQIDRTYGHQLFNGTRRPSRDKVLQLAFGIGLTVEETQALLQAAGKSALYPRLKRDAVILFCLKNGCSMIETQETLDSNGMMMIGESSLNE